MQNDLKAPSKRIEVIDIIESTQHRLETEPSTMDYKNESKLSGLRVHTDSNKHDVHDSTAKKKFGYSNSRSSNSSSPDSPLDDPFSEYEHNEYSKGTTIAKLDEVLQPETKNCETITSVKPVPTANSKSPPTQAMERYVSSAYRIPSHVFVRTKSIAPVEWSVASNESLFSIQMGDSSFGRDSIFNYNYSYMQSPKNLTNMPGKESESKGDESAVETMKGEGKASLTPSVSCHSIHSDVSGSSVDSFAFPILTGNNGKDGSTRAVGSVRIGFDCSSQQLTPMASKKHPLPQPQQPKASPSTCFSWFGCFTCCTSCSK